MTMTVVSGVEHFLMTCPVGNDYFDATVGLMCTTRHILPASEIRRSTDQIKMLEAYSLLNAFKPQHQQQGQEVCQGNHQGSVHGRVDTSWSPPSLPTEAVVAKTRAVVGTRVQQTEGAWSQ